MICRYIDEKINKIRKKGKGLKRSSSHSPHFHNHVIIQSPHTKLRPYHKLSSSPKNKFDSLLLQYIMEVRPDSLPKTPYSSPSLVPSITTISEHSHQSQQIIKNERNNYKNDHLKKGTSYYEQRDYINDILEEDMELSNNILMTIIKDYNRYMNKITNQDYFISRSNLILREYINTNDFKADNIYQAYDFIILGNVVSFWIFYKFLIDDASLNTNYLLYYLELNNVSSNRDDIFNIEIDILKSIDYCVMRFV